MMRRQRLTLLGIFLAGALVACEDDPTEPEFPLTESEAEALFLGMRTLAADTMPTIISLTPTGVVVACPLGGQVTASGGFVEEVVGDTARLVTDFTLTPDGCGFGSSGLEFTVTGNPSVRDRMVITIIGIFEEFLIEGETTGTLDWELDGRTGTCMMDLQLSVVPDFSGNEPVANGTYAGMMCGLEVSFDAGSIDPGG